MSRVRPGVFDVRASLATPVSRLMSDDLPTFERPANAISASVGAGKPAGWLAEMTNVEDLGLVDAIVRCGACSDSVSAQCRMRSYAVLASNGARRVRLS